MSLPAKYRVDEVKAALVKTKGIRTSAAEYLGCTRATVSRYVDKYPSLKKACEHARAEVTDIAESKYFQAIKAGEPWAIRLELVMQGQSRGYTTRVDHEHKGRVEHDHTGVLVAPGISPTEEDWEREVNMDIPQ